MLTACDRIDLREMGKNKSKELVKNTAIISFGKMCTQMISFLLMPFYTAVLTTQEYGIVDLIVTYGQLLLPVFTLQMEQALFRFLIDSRNNEDRKEKVISDILSLTFFMAFILSGVFVIVSFLVRIQYTFYLLGNLWACLFITMFLQIARGLGNNKVFALGSFLSAAGQVLLNIVFVLGLKMGAGGMILAMIIAQLATSVFLAYQLKLSKYFHFRISEWGSLKAYISYSAPLIPNAISWWILNASDRSIILKFLGVGINGIYSAANKFSGIYTTLFNIFNLSWTESVALYLKGENAGKEYTKLQNKIIGLCITTAAGIIYIMPFAFDVLVNKKFADAYYQIPILVMGAFFSSMVGLGSAYYIADKKTAVIARTTIFGAICNISINLALITKVGLYAASISTVVAYFILFIVRTIHIKKAYGVSYNIKLLASGVILMLLGYGTYFIDKTFVYVVAFIVFCVYAFMVNWSVILSAYRIIHNKIERL